MQTDSSSSTVTANTMSASPFKSQLFHPNDVVYSSLYSPPTYSSDSLNSDSVSNSNSNSDSNRLYHSRTVQEHQEIVNRNSLYLTRLREATGEVEALRQENSHLHVVNRELNKQLSLLIQALLRSSATSNDFTTAASFSALDAAFRRLRIGGGGMNEGSDHDHDQIPWDDVAVPDLIESPTSVIESGRLQNADVERFSLPKSISVRSNGYLKNNPAHHQPTGSTRTTRTATRPRPASPLNVTQKVYVPGVKKEEEPLELEVYNQGMYKTELCNKWQETGECPYGDNCQFAHGVEELRPVLRHPRYKTEVCRMVLTGVVCPYGHRCHFRHALTDQERAMGPLLPRAIKLEK
nr:zinc finger ccch domain-containing protein 15 [Quercus suber]